MSFAFCFYPHSFTIIVSILYWKSNLVTVRAEIVTLDHPGKFPVYLQLVVCQSNLPSCSYIYIVLHRIPNQGIYQNTAFQWGNMRENWKR
jgi:hypothetical protein